MTNDDLKSPSGVLAEWFGVDEATLNEVLDTAGLVVVRRSLVDSVVRVASSLQGSSGILRSFLQGVEKEPVDEERVIRERLKQRLKGYACKAREKALERSEKRAPKKRKVTVGDRPHVADSLPTKRGYNAAKRAWKLGMSLDVVAGYLNTTVKRARTFTTKYRDDFPRRYSTKKSRQLNAVG